MDERLIVTREPLNAEARLELQDGPITPSARHYVRSHFAFPAPSGTISIGGAVGHPRALTVAQVRALPSRTAMVTLECAGNGRSFLQPPAPGEQWRLGAVSTAEWTGVALRSVLEPAALSSGTIEILFRGGDRGTPPDVGSAIAFERSLPLARALADDVLIAYAMNGSAIPREHGAPLRLIVPTWYGMASVKWLTEIVALERPFSGFYQRDRYVIGDEPLAQMKPRAIIVAPSGVVAAGRVTVRGYAWSGQGEISRVDLSADAGATWREATLGARLATGAWRDWQMDWDAAPGSHALLARATDSSGDVQPIDQRRNALGYANNAAQPERVEAR